MNLWGRDLPRPAAVTGGAVLALSLLGAGGAYGATGASAPSSSATTTNSGAPLLETADAVVDGKAPEKSRVLPLAAPRAEATTTSGESVTTTPELYPAFNPANHDYVTRCEGADSVTATISAPEGTAVTIDGKSASTGSVKLAAGQRFAFTIGGESYDVRCLPSDFPAFSAERYSTPQASYYLVTPTTTLAAAPKTPYVALFNNYGAPVWWLRSTDAGNPVDASLTPDDHVLFAKTYGATVSFGQDWGDHVEERSLDGKIVKDRRPWWVPTDFHEARLESNGNLLVSAYQRHDNQNLWSIGVPWGVTVLDATFQELRPDGVPVYGWSASGKVQASESLRFANALFPYTGVFGVVWDWQHLNSVEPDGANAFIISLRHTDAVYKIDRASGRIVWKLGGTKTAQSLKVVGDPYTDAGGLTFGGQHDARILPNGDISVHDNGTFLNRPPRVMIFHVDEATKTATLVNTITDDKVTASPCCGSARQTKGGDFVVAWGGTQLVSELTPDSTPVFRLTFAPPKFSYRAVPVEQDQLDRSQLVNAMDGMHPRG